MEIIDEQELATRLHIHIRTIQRARNDARNTFPFVKFNGKVLYDFDVVRAIFQTGSTPRNSASGRSKQTAIGASKLVFVNKKIALKRGRPRKQI